MIRGNLSFGALVAVLAAYKDMASPWKELLDFYQQKEDSRIKYEQIVEQFQPAGLTDPALMLRRARRDAALCRASWRSAISRLPRTIATASSTRSRSACGSTSMSRSSGQSGSGKNELALLLARLMRPTGGRITIGGHELGELPLAVVGHRIGYARRPRTCSPAHCATIC